jgi:hypothetical protein
MNPTRLFRSMPAQLITAAARGLPFAKVDMLGAVQGPCPEVDGSPIPVPPAYLPRNLQLLPRAVTRLVTPVSNAGDSRHKFHGAYMLRSPACRPRPSK